ncbi:hypothetical protein ABZV67_45925 [Streptomyces sp. NPDC005065]|uniref:hypothetical protein n=1 Tax=Streptomyces sp. NPDC005065 TaxID=3154461 RepID=UPI0033BB41FE
MNQLDPQLTDTPTWRAAAAPFRPRRRSSKYRRLADDGMRLAPPRGMRTISSRTFATTDGIQAVYPVIFIDAIHVKIRVLSTIL